MAPSQFPQHRPRRLRQSAVWRDALADVALGPDHLIYPLFVGDLDQPRPVASMPGVQQWPVDQAVKQIAQLRQSGLKQFLLFGVTPSRRKDPRGSYAWNKQAPVNRTLAAVRKTRLDVLLYADLCFCEYTSHGHCGPIDQNASAPAGVSVNVDNDATLKNLARTAVVQARCGADVVAPSGMMDGQVGAIRQALDQAGFPRIAILSYSVKYASAFYGPFREAGEGGMKFGDRRGYQMDYRRSREWRDELRTDLAQGADLVMVKPAGAYLDIVRQVRDQCDQLGGTPVVAYQVSGEYAMIHAAAKLGWLDLRSIAVESALAIRRAGADLIITYFAPQLLQWLGKP